MTYKESSTRTSPHADIDSWASQEFGRVCLGDKRLERRLKVIATDFARQPRASIPKACGSWAQSKGAYRFFDNRGVSAEAILESHRMATIERMGAEKLLFAIQDTTFLNYTDRPNTSGLGPIGNNSDKTKGLIAHCTLVVNPEGVAMGVIDASILARKREQFGDNKRRNQKPIQEKESFRWLEGFRAVQRASALLPQGCQVVSVADREADIYDLLALATEKGNRVGLLVRAQHDRGVEHEENRLWKWLRSQPVAATLGVEVPACVGRKRRVAILSIRFSKVALKCPLLKEGRSTLHLWGVEALENNPPSGVEPICWKLLTTVAVDSAKDAIERVLWYKLRWQIEVFHKILKSGCQIEERQLESAQRLKRCAAVDMVVAWRILHLTIQSRYTPNAPASCFLEEYEWKALHCFIHKTNLPPAEPPSMSKAIGWIAQLGGFLNRKSDGYPGPVTLWRGLHRLNDIAEAYLVFNPPTCG